MYRYLSQCTSKKIKWKACTLKEYINLGINWIEHNISLHVVVNLSAQYNNTMKNLI